MVREPRNACNGIVIVAMPVRIAGSDAGGYDAGMNVLLTGHGTLGLPLAQRLVAMGHTVGVLSRAARDDVPWQVHPGCLEHADEVLAAADGCDVIIHNGGRQADRHNLAAHSDFLLANVLATGHVFQAAVRTGVRHVVYLSSDSVLGGAGSADERDAASRARLVRDSDPPEVRTIYDMTKLLGEQLAAFYRRQHGLSVTTLRPGWFARPNDLPEHEFAWRLLGQCVWVGDVIAAVLAAMTQPAQGEYLIHAATPFGESDAVELLADPMAVLRRYWPGEAEWWVSQKLPAPPIRWWADIAPATDRLGFVPELDFARAVARMREGRSPWPTAGMQVAP